MGGVVSSIFGGGQTPSISSTTDTSAAEAEAKRKQRLAANSAGRSSLLSTGGQGLTGDAETSQSLLRAGLKNKLGE